MFKLLSLLGKNSKAKEWGGAGIPHQMSLETYGLRTVVQKNLFQCDKKLYSSNLQISIVDNFREINGLTSVFYSYLVF